MNLVLNVGSSSLKFSLYDEAAEHLLARGLFSRIGQAGSTGVFESDRQRTERNLSLPSHASAADEVFKWLRARFALHTKLVVAHRVVHGGRLTTHSVINEAVENAIRDACSLAPLHNPPALSVIRRTRDTLGDGVPMVAILDTAFFAELPELAFRYPIPWDLSERHGIRRYGFHGLAHQWMMDAASRTLAKPSRELTAITLQLGSGCSAALVANGRAADTSMGMTPLEGLMMGTRSGSIDPAIVGMLSEAENLSIGEVNEILNFESGLKGVSGISGDWRDVEIAAGRGDERAEIATSMLAYSVRKQIGAYLAAAEARVDAIVFGGGIGEHSSTLRHSVLKQLDHLGIEIDQEKNRQPQSGSSRLISTMGSATEVVVTHVDEMHAIAKLGSEAARAAEQR